MRLLAACALAALAGCAPRTGARAPVERAGVRMPPDESHVPDFARKPYAAFSRESVVAIALREWRLFGQKIDDDPPNSRPPPAPEDKPERQEGLWQRVGEYWWLGIDADRRQTAWTGKHDEYGVEFSAEIDGRYAWSAAFVSYVMRIAGAGPRFPYSPTHADYINIAKQQADGQTSGWAITAERLEGYAPVPGDLICQGRGGAARLRYDDLPTGDIFPGHCDVVVQTAPGAISVVGGNVDDAVTMKHVPVTAEGRMAGPDGIVLDGRYPWLAVLRVGGGGEQISRL